MFCPKCGTTIHEGATFCIKCGASLAPFLATTEVIGPLPHHCARCGSELEPQMVYCGRCGARVAGQGATAGHRLPRAALIAAAGAGLLLLVAAGIVGFRRLEDSRQLEDRYGAGLAALEAGEAEQAVAELSWVAAQEPDYEEVQPKLAEAQVLAELAAQYGQAQAAFAEGDWPQVIGSLEGLRAREPDYQAEAVAELLGSAYTQAGRELAAEGDLEAAVAHLEEALALPHEPGVEEERQVVALTLEGLTALEEGDPCAAREALAQAVALAPGNAQASAALYTAHTGCCDILVGQGQLDEAEAEGRAALELVPGGQEATACLAHVAAARTPTPTPSPEPTATWTPSPTVAATLTPTATPRPAATAAPRCREAAPGLIGFKRQPRCNARTGDGCGTISIWVMNADGTGQAPMCHAADYTWGLVRDRTSPDGTWRVEVGGNRGGDIMRLYQDGRQEMIIVNNRVDWDPVLSLDGWWLAWVTNRNANDEIYIKTLDPADQNQRRLTVNAWEWDKHPSWSPDGRRIAFYSNRANKLNEATRQIWVMDIVNDQGANLRNLSNRPDMVDTDPVWFKWPPP